MPKKRSFAKKIFRFIGFTLLSIIGLILTVSLIIVLYINFGIRTIPEPIPEDLSSLELERTQIDSNFYNIGNNWIRKSNTGLWEMYIEGTAFERGVINGKLSKELIIKQEDAFVDQIKEMIPSMSYLRFLKYLIKWFNSDIDTYIKKEYLLEIYGISFSASDDYEYIGTKYHRILNYHAAHDIGHALQDLNMAGCTSFSAWNGRSEDSSLIIGRNFDFYVGDKFAEDKIIYFANPFKGYKYMVVSWGGMIGAVSGMNEYGLTVTINAAKSDMPQSAKNPISLLAREMLQYSKNIEEAYEIAKNRDLFVSEAIMIGSAEDNETAIIEKSPTKTDIFYSDKKNHILCSNHFQSNTFKNEESNIENIKTSSSNYRYKRLEELLEKFPALNIYNTAEILRDQKGLNDKNIGMSNEKAMNQLIAHHSIIFKPHERKFWISTSPWQLGKYVCYDLNKIFEIAPGLKENKEIYEQNLIIEADSFLYTDNYKDFLKYQALKNEIIKSSKENKNFSDNEIEELISANPEFYLVFSLVGDYYLKKGEVQKAKEYYEIALSKEIPVVSEIEKIKEHIRECVKE